MIGEKLQTTNATTPILLITHIHIPAHTYTHACARTHIYSPPHTYTHIHARITITIV